MGVVTRKPNGLTVDGPFSTIEGGAGQNTLGDTNDGTFVSLKGIGTIRASYPAMAAASIPTGRKIIGPRVTHKYNYAALQWILPQLRAPESYLLRQGQRIPVSQLFNLDDRARTGMVSQAGPVMVKDDYSPWTLAEINELSTEHLNRYPVEQFIDVNEVAIDVVYSEPLPALVPQDVYPRNNVVVDTTNVNFAATQVAPQADQGVRLVFQVATDTAFTANVKTFYSSHSFATAAGSRITYNGVAGTPSDTALAPGKWYMRVKAQDVALQETAWTATVTFTVALAALPVPTLVDPVPGSIVTSPYAVRTANVSQSATDNRAQSVEFQFSAAATFTAPVGFTTPLSYDLGKRAYDPTGDASQYLGQRVWYVRVRSKDKWGLASAWSTAQTFTVSHPPLAIGTSPTANGVIDQDRTPLSWQFADSWKNDEQTAYRVRIYDEANVLIKDSGKVAGKGNAYYPALAVAYRYRALRWTVELFDKDDRASATLTNNYFKISVSPQVNLPYPAQNELVRTGQPTITWQPGTAGDSVQKSFLLTIKRSVDNVEVFRAGESSKRTSVTPPQVVLKNATDYVLTLIVTDSDGLSTTVIRNFRAEYQSPPDVNFTVDTDSYRTNGYVLVDWTMFSPDNYFIRWNVYRREVGTPDWELLLTDTNSSRRTYQDWMVPSNSVYQYMVTQVADRSGYELESYLNPDAPSGIVVAEDYWLLVPNRPDMNLRLYSVAGDSFTDDIEVVEQIIKGRGRRINYGTRLGISGTLSAKLRDSSLPARQQMLKLRSLQDARVTVMMRDPFGNVTRIALGESIGYERVPGVGNSEFVDVSIPYKQVF